MTRHVTKVYGPPGSGKTTYLLNRLDEFLDQGIHPSDIAFISFTRAACNEARGRAMVRFGFKAEDLPWFRTLHSAAYHQLAMSSERLVTDDTRIERLADMGFDIQSWKARVRTMQQATGHEGEKEMRALVH